MGIVHCHVEMLEKGMPRCRKMWINASFSMEAALLLPVIIGILLLFSQTALYFHDRNVTACRQQVVSTYARNKCMAGEEDIVGQARQYAAGWDKEEVFGSEASVSVSGGRQWVKVSAEISYSDYFPGWERFSGRPASREDSLEDGEWVVHPCKLIRGWRLVKEGMETD